MATKDKALAQQGDENKALVVGNFDYGEMAGVGFENQTRDDYAIPFLGILQGLSPQLETVDGAKPGLIINTVTNDLHPKDGVAFVPAWTEHLYVEWKPRDQGGGFVGVHAIDSEVVSQARNGSQEFGKYSTLAGNDLIETFYVYGLVVREDGGLEQAVLAFSSTKIKKYKAWMTKAKMIQIDLGGGRRINAPLPAHRYRLRTIKEKNTKGEYWNWDISFDGTNAVECRLAPDSPEFQEAVNVMKLVKSGAARAAHETQGGAGSGGDEAGSDSDPQAIKASGGKAPF